jgi:pilus assembly protein Flp/PilA
MKDMAMKKLVLAFRHDEAGATAVEYALIALGITVAIAAGVQGLGTSVNSLYLSVQAAFK